MVDVVKGERIEAKLLVKRKLGRSMVGGLGKPHFQNSEGEILGRFWSGAELCRKGLVGAESFALEQSNPRSDAKLRRG